MKTILAAVLALSAFSLSTNAAAVQKRVMDPALKRSLASAVIVVPQDPPIYRLLAEAAVPGASTGAADTVSMNLTASLRPDPRVSSALARGIQDELERRGVRTRLVAAPPLAKDGKSLDYSQFAAKEQMIVEPVITEAGYRNVGGVLRPVLAAQVRVLDATTREEKMLETFLYADKGSDQFVLLPVSAEWSFKNIEAIYADGERATFGLRAGIIAICQAAVPLMREWEVKIQPRGKTVELPL